MTKVQFGANDNLLEGWINLRNETDGDITKRLAFDDGSVDLILIEHCLEHVSPQDGYRFLREAWRILKVRGVIRVVVPDIDKIWRKATPEYRALVAEGIKTWWPAIGWSVPENHVPSDREIVESLIFCHGHKAVFTEDLLFTLMETSGFDCEPCDYGKSRHPGLNAVDGHHGFMGLENCVLESAVVEGTKE